MGRTDNPGQDPKLEAELLAHRLAAETKISLSDAKALIELIGTDWNSLLREARFLKARN